MFLPWLTLFDFANIRSHLKVPIDPDDVKTRCEDYALLVPIFNDLKYLANIDFLKKYAAHVVLCTTNHETPEFVSRLEALAAEHGFKVSYSEIVGSAKNPWAIYHKTLLAHDSVLKSTIHHLPEKYVIFIDADTVVDGDLAVLCGAMEERSFDIASVRILPSQRSNVIEHLQGVEYDIAMRNRLLYPWLTSGAGMVARTDVMIAIMENHSLFFNGGDIEIGKLADLMGYHVGHIPMVFYTDIPDTFNKWVRQRRSWMCGMFRHSVINWDLNIKHPFHFLYFTLIIYGLYPFKVAEMIQHLYLMPLILGLYAAATYLANWKVRSRWMLIFPLYAMFQVLVVIWFGIFRYIVTVRRTGNWGRIRVTHNGTARPSRRQLWATTKHLSYVSLTSAAILLGTIEPIQKWVFGKHIDIGSLALKAGQGMLDAFATGIQSAYQWLVDLPVTTSMLLSVLVALVITLALHYVPSLLASAAFKRFSVSAGVSASRRLSRTLAQVNRKIELNPQSPTHFFHRGQLLERKGQPQRSVEDYSHAIELYQAALESKQILPQKQCTLDNYEHALLSWKEKLNPDLEFLAQLYRSRSDIYYERLQITEALADSLSALNLAPTVGDLYRLRTLRWAMQPVAHTDAQPAMSA